MANRYRWLVFEIIFYYFDGDFLVILLVDAFVDVREYSLAKLLTLLESVLLEFYLIALEVAEVRNLLRLFFAHICVVLWKNFRSFF